MTRAWTLVPGIGGTRVQAMTEDPALRRLGEGEGRKLLLLGDVRTIKAGSPEAGGGLTVVEQVAAPGAAASLHRHRRRSKRPSSRPPTHA